MADPWFKFYPTDWISDPGLRLCSRAARGLWIDMLTLMHKATPRGELRVAGIALDAASLSRCLGEPLEEVTADLAELERAGVFSRRKNGVIYSRKMVRDEEKARKLRANGAKGGNPSLCKTKTNGALDNQPDKPTEARSQKPEAKDTNVSKKRAPKKQEKAHRLPDDWQIPEEWIDEAVSRGLTRVRAYAEAERMRNWSQSSPNGAKVKWLAVWRNWIADKADQPAKPAQPADRHIAAAASRRDAWLDVIDEIEGRGDGGDSWQPASASSPARLSGPRGGYDGSG